MNVLHVANVEPVSRVPTRILKVAGQRLAPENCQSIAKKLEIQARDSSVPA
jgi:hypothetical protein